MASHQMRLSGHPTQSSTPTALPSPPLFNFLHSTHHLMRYLRVYSLSAPIRIKLQDAGSLWCPHVSQHPEEWLASIRNEMLTKCLRHEQTDFYKRGEWGALSSEIPTSDSPTRNPSSTLPKILIHLQPSLQHGRCPLVIRGEQLGLWSQIDPSWSRALLLTYHLCEDGQIT